MDFDVGELKEETQGQMDVWTFQLTLLNNSRKSRNLFCHYCHPLFILNIHYNSH